MTQQQPAPDPGENLGTGAQAAGCVAILAGLGAVALALVGIWTRDGRWLATAAVLVAVVAVSVTVGVASGRAAARARLTARTSRRVDL